MLSSVKWLVMWYVGGCPDTVHNVDRHIHNADKYYDSSFFLDLEYKSRVLWSLLVFRNIMQGLKYDIAHFFIATDSRKRSLSLPPPRARCNK